MIRALPAILAAHPNTYYLIVGSGSHQDALREEVRRADLEDRVILLECAGTYRERWRRAMYLSFRR